MAIIPIRVYIHEIEGLIDSGQLDEAVAHCRHILTTFPKHIASYRLLGKAHLEQQRISDATDLFQRVLSSIPDDITANVGMSMIREDENNLDAAIWHMELAYEAQPSNVAIQDELRRLYGRRDGTQPLKIRLTRGALARMYSKGGLYDQAIAELHAAISEDPNRHDLQLLLAQMHFQISQRVEAVETCATILKKLPFCLVANQILSVCLPEKGATETAKNYRQVAVSMDPYFAFTEREDITTDKVPDNAVNIEKLEWKPGLHANETTPQPSWATTLGISLEKSDDEKLPEWLMDSGVSHEEEPAPEAEQKSSPFLWDTQEVEKIITTPANSEDIPDWMKDAGWTPSTSSEQPEPPAELAEPLPADDAQTENIEKGEIPDWLKGIAPEEMFEEKPAEEQAKQEDISLPWLEKQTPGPTDSIIQWLEDKQPESITPPAIPEVSSVENIEEEIPAWLKNLDEPSSSVSLEKTPAESTSLPPTSSAFMDEPPEAEPAVPIQAFTAPIEEIQNITEPVVETSGDVGQLNQEEELPDASLDDLPDWIKELAGVSLEASEPIIPGSEQKGEYSTEQTLGVPNEIPAFVVEESISEQPISEIEQPAIEMPVSEIDEHAVEIPITEVEEPVVEAPFSGVEEAGAEVPFLQTEVHAEEIPASEVEEPVVEAPFSGVEEAGAEISGIERQEGTSEVPTPEIDEVNAEVPVSQTEVPAAEMPPPESQESDAEFPSMQVDGAASESVEAVAEAPTQEATLDIGITPPHGLPLPPFEETALNEEETPASVSPIDFVTAEEEQPNQEAAFIDIPAGEEVPPRPSESDSLAWLTELAAEKANSQQEGELAEEQRESPLDWMQSETATTSEAMPPISQIAPEEAPAIPAEEIPDWIKGLGELPDISETSSESLSDLLTPPPPEVNLPKAEEVPSWLLELEQSDEEVEVPVPQGLEWKEEQLPDWIQEIAQANPTIETASEQIPTGVEAPPAPSETALEWTAEEPQLSDMDAEIHVESQTQESTWVAEVQTAPELAPDALPEDEPVPSSVIEELVAKVLEIPSEPAEPTDDQGAQTLEENKTVLEDARNAVALGQTSQAVELYCGLIKQNFELDSIIQDLQVALYRYPVDVNLWVSLGDAYFKTHELQEALNTYTKAEELIR